MVARGRKARVPRRVSCARLGAVFVLVVSAAGSGQAPAREPHAFLREHLSFSSVELRLAEVGRPVVKELATPLKREITIVGVIRIEADPEAFVAAVTDIERFERGAGVLATRKISTPPAIADFDTMTLPHDDLKALPKCRVGDCLVKIDRAALARFQTEVDWSARDAEARANAIARRLLYERLLAYQREGDAGLGELIDRPHPTVPGEEFAGMLEGDRHLPARLPELYDYLRTYPAGKPETAEEFFYWSKVSFGLRDTVRLNHVVVYRNPDAPAEVAIASKLLYATHYFNTALDLRYVTRGTEGAESRGFYLLTVLRSRTDGMTGVFGGAVRRRAVKVSSEALARHLLAVKRELEQPGVTS